MKSTIKLSHGNGGRDTAELIHELFYKHFKNPILVSGMDSAILKISAQQIAFTTDTFVVKPIKFPGGDIGKLAICGTVNDLSVSGAKPLYISCGFVIEEGFELALLEEIIISMAQTSKDSGVKIVTGDTKVVEKGAVDQIFINTSGIGIIENNYSPKKILAGDQIILTGTIAEHGTTIAIEQFKLDIKGHFSSDCSPINILVEKLKPYMNYIKLMKDPTRGGIATTLNEIAAYAGLGIHVLENSIPIREEILAVNQLLGIDPLYLACEGRMILAVNKEQSSEILNIIRGSDDCKKANIIGEFINDSEKTVFVQNNFGGKRIIRALEGEMVPRIC